ncbi:MAG: Rne/Rng family ribonuclease [Candidatus Omnitrophota bacterium]
MKQILINVEPYEKRVAITSGQSLEEFHVERMDIPRLAGNIYKGVIESVVPGIGAIFVDIGTGKNGFLYVEDMDEKMLQTLLQEEIVIEKKKEGARRPIERLKKGQEILVQVVKEPIGTKGPLLTSEISLPGKYLVLMPFSSTLGISKRIEDRQQRAKIKECLEKMGAPDGAGFIARTQCVNANPRKLKLEFRHLSILWSRIQRRAGTIKPPGIVFEEYDLPLRMIRDCFDDEVEKILIDSKEEYRKVYRFANSIQPELKRKIFFYKGKVPIYERYGVEERLEKMFHRKIYLKSGGHIVIEQTEGLVAIDVNTGKFKGKRNLEETVYKTNLEAATEIAKQTMIRDIGGIIVIDFIDMNERSHRRGVYETLERAFRDDKAKINILTISSIGLIEMTRQRIRKSPESFSFRECPYCNGRGRVKTPATIAIETVRKLGIILRDRPSRDVFVVIHPDVVEYMEKTFKDVFRSLERRFRKRIIIKSDHKLHVEDVHFE